jgi:hypothetical protein
MSLRVSHLESRSMSFTVGMEHVCHLEEVT